MHCFIINLTIVVTISLGVAQEVHFSPEPATPSPADQVVLTITKDFPTPCFRTTATLIRNGMVVSIQMNSEKTSEFCPQVITPQSVQLELGALEPGTYSVNLTWSGIPGEKTVKDTAAFHVLPPLQIRGRRPTVVEFPCPPGAVYQIQLSTDGRNWLPFGNQVVGEGRMVSLTDEDVSADRKFYRIQLLRF